MNYVWLGNYYLTAYIIRIIKQNSDHNLVTFFFLNSSITEYLKVSFYSQACV